MKEQRRKRTRRKPKSRPNASVLAILFLSAVSVAAAVFLILELDGPVDGFIKVSSGPLRYALAQLGQ